MSRKFTSNVAVTLMLSLAASHVVGAHDFWIEPSTFTPAMNTAVRVHFRVGDHFTGETLGRNENAIERFVSIAPDGIERPIVGRHGTDPAGVVRVDAPGLWILAYRGKPSTITLAAETFERYLKEEGLERVSRERARLGDGGKSGREHFSRAVKSLVVAGVQEPSTLNGYDRAIGLALELVPEANPFDPGRAELPVRLLFEGTPLEGALIVAMRKASRTSRTEVVSSVRSDAGGRARIATGPGLWLIKAVHMVRAAEGSEVEWESTWTSLTFEIDSRQ